MKKLEKILAPTDLSDLSLVALQHALETAANQGAQVIIYHVADYREAIPYPIGFDESGGSQGLQVHSLEDFIEQRKKELGLFLNKKLAHLILRVPVRLEVEIGVAFERIVEKATKEEVDMIVMSTHGRTGLLHVLIGSVTEQVVRRAGCPVLSIRPSKEKRGLKEAAA